MEITVIKEDDFSILSVSGKMDATNASGIIER